MTHTFVRTSDKLAIVGSHAETRDLGPWDDETYDVWVINEAPQYPWCKRYTASINIHRSETYHNPNGISNMNHWAWLQEEHGKPIWMQDIDPEVPDSVRFPFKEMEDWPPAKPNGKDMYFTSSPAYILALGLFLGYKEIHTWAIDLSSNTEYTFQANCWRYWVGVAKGMLGNNFRIMEGGKHLFKSKLYGYDEDPRVGAEYFKKRIEVHEAYLPTLKKRCDRLRNDLADILLGIDKDIKRFPTLFTEAKAAYQELGALMGKQSTAVRLSERPDTIHRQEYEWHAAKAQSDSQPLTMQIYSTTGKMEYVFNAWLQGGSLPARNQVISFLDEVLKLSQDLGLQSGLYQENVFYLNEFDQRLVVESGGDKLDELNAIQVTEVVK